MKDTDNYDYYKIQKVGKDLGLKLNLKQMLEEGFKNKEFANPIREKILYKLWETINNENGITVNNTFKKGYSKLFKYFIGKGNNGHSIRNLMNQRWWWQSHTKENIIELNFLWTQWKVDSQLDKLPSKIPKPEIKVKDEGSDKEDDEPSTAKTEEDDDPESSTKAVLKSTINLPSINLPHDSNKCYNRLEKNFNLTSKKYLYLNMKEYYESMGQDVFSILPVTFHVKDGENDPEFIRFSEYFNKFEQEREELPDKKNVWIIKPGENSNRGNGITVSSNLEEIKTLLNTLAIVSKRT